MDSGGKMYVSEFTLSHLRILENIAIPGVFWLYGVHVMGLDTEFSPQKLAEFMQPPNDREIRIIEKTRRKIAVRNSEIIARIADFVVIVRPKDRHIREINLPGNSEFANGPTN